MENLTYSALSRALATLRTHRPVVLNLTNFVVMNPTAKALLALGASPIMAHAEAELEEMAHIASSLVINIGTLDEACIPRYKLALSGMRKLGKGVVLDPVGAGASKLRTQTCLSLLEAEGISILRGNASEIMALAGAAHATKGVDSTASGDAALQAGVQLYQRYGATVCISGPTDYVVQDDVLATLTGGSALMPLITGTGCTASAICGAFLTVEPAPELAAAYAMAMMALAGEKAGAVAKGPGTFWPPFLDALYSINEGDLAARYPNSLEDKA